MMKNVYALGGFQIDKKDFKLNVLFYVDTIGNRLNYIPVSQAEPNVYAKALNRLFNLDKLNVNNDPRPDGEYDFIEGVTINSNSGRIIFPVREPFGGFLRSQFVSQTNADVYAYDVLYDSTKVVALQFPEKNKFSLKGIYSSKFGSDIPLNQLNIPEGSVKVTAGGIPLTENIDYTVDIVIIGSTKPTSITTITFIAFIAFIPRCTCCTWQALNPLDTLYPLRTLS